MQLVNPFEEVVLFGKKLSMEPESSTTIGALRPTGKHVGHANDLVRVRGKASGGKATRLERYTTSPKGLKQGPFTTASVGLRQGPFTTNPKGFESGPFKKGLDSEINKGIGASLKSGAGRVGRSLMKKPKAAPASSYVSDAPKFNFDGPAHPPAPKMNWDKPQPRSKLMDDAAARRAKAAQPKKTPRLATPDEEEANYARQSKERATASRSAAIRNDHYRTRHVPGGKDASGTFVPGGFSYTQ